MAAQVKRGAQRRAPRFVAAARPHRVVVVSGCLAWPMHARGARLVGPWHPRRLRAGIEAAQARGHAFPRWHCM